MSVNWNDPAERLAALNTAYMELISGAKESRVRFQNNDYEQEVQFHPANLQALKDAIADTKAEIAGTTRRAAIRFGSRRLTQGYF